MPDLPRHLKQLEQELLALDEDAMLLEVLDGFIVGLLVCSELIMPSEWLRWVWDSEEGREPAFDSLAHLNKVVGLVMQHYNGTARLLAEWPDHYGPLFAIDPRNDDICGSRALRPHTSCARQHGRNASPRTRKPRRPCPGCGTSSMPFSTIGNYPKNNTPPYAPPHRTTSLDGSSLLTSGASRMTSLPTCRRHSMPHQPARSDAMNHAPAVQEKNIKNAAQSTEPRLSADAYNATIERSAMNGWTSILLKVSRRHRTTPHSGSGRITTNDPIWLWAG
jgi:hypothetical protein